jgi:hypothetical protein
MPFVQQLYKTDWTLSLQWYLYVPSSDHDVIFKYWQNITGGIKLPLQFMKFC